MPVLVPVGSSSPCGALLPGADSYKDTNIQTQPSYVVVNGYYIRSRINSTGKNGCKKIYCSLVNSLSLHFSSLFLLNILGAYNGGHTPVGKYRHYIPRCDARMSSSSSSSL